MAQPSGPGAGLGPNVGQCLLVTRGHRCQGTQLARRWAKPQCTGNTEGGALEPELVLSFLCASPGLSVGGERQASEAWGVPRSDWPGEAELGAAVWRVNALRERLSCRLWPWPW